MTKKLKSNKFRRFLNSIHPKYIFFDFVRLTLGLPLLISYLPKYHYMEGAKKHRFLKGSAIIASNHISFLDGLMMSFVWLSRRPHIVIAEDAYNSHPFLRWFLKNMYAISVSRSSISMAKTKEIMARLKLGEVVGIYPEGHIIHSSKVESLMPGMSFFAIKTGSPIIPMLLTEPPRVFRRNHFFIGKAIDSSLFPDSSEGRAELDRAVIDSMNQMYAERDALLQVRAEKAAKKAAKRNKSKHIDSAADMSK